MRHFGIIEMGGRGGPDVPFILSEIVVPVQYREYNINLFLMIFARMSLHCKLVPVQYREYDINLFLMIFPVWASMAS